jgi:beta-hydroxylase
MEIVERLRSYRRTVVKTTGRRLLKRLSNFYAEQSTVGQTPFLDPGLFPFTAALETNWMVIREELQEVLKYREAIPTFHDVSPDQSRISTGRNWQTFVLFGFKQKMEKNCSLCPRTAEILEGISGLQTAWFSILRPRYHVPRHKGVTRGILTCHLGLVIPPEIEQCRIEVKGETRHWEEGRTLVFDDGMRHEVWNNSDQDRIVLLIQFSRPMRPLGRLVNATTISLLKLTAYLREPKKNMIRLQEKFQEAMREDKAG